MRLLCGARSATRTMRSAIYGLAKHKQFEWSPFAVHHPSFQKLTKELRIERQWAIPDLEEAVTEQLTRYPRPLSIDQDNFLHEHGKDLPTLTSIGHITPKLSCCLIASLLNSHLQ